MEASVIKCGGFYAQSFVPRIILINQSCLEFDDKVSTVVKGKKKTRSTRSFTEINASERVCFVIE